MIHPQAVDQPVRILVFLRVLPDVFRASWILDGIVARSLFPEVVLASPVTTESGIENDLMILEVRINVTLSLSSRESWKSPLRWIWLFRCDIFWHTSPFSEIPYSDHVASPFHHENTSTDAIKRRSVRVRISVCSCTALSRELSTIIRECGQVVAVVSGLIARFLLSFLVTGD